MQVILSRTKDEIRNKFASLETNEDIADLLEINLQTLLYYAYRLDKVNQYISFEIPKRNGEKRIISTPSSNLKILQKKLNYILQNVYTPRKCAFGFVKGKNVIKNAREHKGSRFVLRIDLRDFFSQIHFGRIRGTFMVYPFEFNLKVASTLANLCVYETVLPQGAPTSPIVSNIICWGLDKDLEEFARKFKCKYTRYGDDITISTKQQLFPKEIAKQDLEQIILAKGFQDLFKKHRFEINELKISLKKNNKRQIVTGLVVNQFENVKREYVRQIRKALFIWEKFGINEVGKFFQKSFFKHPYKGVPNHKWVINGKLDFLKQVRGKDTSTYKNLKQWFDYLDIKDQFNNLSASLNYQTRGYKLEDVLAKLFKINKIDVKEPFHRRKGVDYIDGAIVLSTGQSLILECKWSKLDKINQEIKAFQTDVINSGDGTLGIFISINSWNPNAIQGLETSRNKNIILMNGSDFTQIFNNRKVELDKFIQWRLKKLSQEVLFHVPVKNYITENKFF